MKKSILKSSVSVILILTIILSLIFVFNSLSKNVNRTREGIISNQEIENLDNSVSNTFLKYKSLSTDEKRIYKNMLSAINKFENYYCSKNELGENTKEKINDIFNDCILLDFPQIFWVSDSIEISNYDDAGTIQTEFDYLFSYEEAKVYNKEVNSFKNNVLQQADFNDDTSQYDRALWCYEWILKNIELNSDDAAINNTIWSPIIKNTANSASASKLYQYLMKCFGIDSSLIFATDKISNQPITLNIVNIDEDYSFIDIFSSYSDGSILYSYFGESKKSLSDRLTVSEKSADLSQLCNNEDLQFLIHKNLMITDVEGELIEKIKMSASYDMKPIQIRFSDDAALQNAVNILEDKNTLANVFKEIENTGCIVNYQRIQIIIPSSIPNTLYIYY